MNSARVLNTITYTVVVVAWSALFGWLLHSVASKQRPPIRSISVQLKENVLRPGQKLPVRVVISVKEICPAAITHFVVNLANETVWSDLLVAEPVLPSEETVVIDTEYNIGTLPYGKYRYIRSRVDYCQRDNVSSIADPIEFTVSDEISDVVPQPALPAVREENSFMLRKDGDSAGNPFVFGR